MNKKLVILIKAVLAGMMIGTGCIVYSMCSSKLLGAFLFSFGLFTICNYGLNLYTGKIGYLVNDPSASYVVELLLTLAGNVIGTALTAFLVNSTRLAPSIASFVGPVVETKNADSFMSLIVLAFFCGILMFIGVDLYKKAANPVSQVMAVVFAVVIFILAGFEHCVADMFYMFAAKNTDWARLAAMVLGNSLGGIFACASVTAVTAGASEKPAAAKDARRVPSAKTAS